MRLGPYELVRNIGSGGMGEVWAAHSIHEGPKALVAVKRLPEKLAREVTYRQILLDEARLSMLLRHPNIVHVFDAGEADGEAYIAMEFVHGLDLSRLRKILEQNGQRLPTSVVAHIIAETLRGLDYAHNLVHNGELLSLIHRDVSPHNVMLATSGAVKITDFGVARLATEDTSGTHVKGKARYMPPEQLRGESRSPRVDLFALGAIMQELLDGVAFRSEAMDDARLLGMAVDGYVPPPLRPFELPRELATVRAALLDPDPQSRVQTARDALDMLLAWPGYRDSSQSIADLVQDTLEAQIAAGNMISHTDLAQRPTDRQERSGLELVVQQTEGPPIDDFNSASPGVELEGMLLAPEDHAPAPYKHEPSHAAQAAAKAADEAVAKRRTGGHVALSDGQQRSVKTGAYGEIELELELDVDDGISQLANAKRSSTGANATLELEDDPPPRPAPRRPATMGPGPELDVDAGSSFTNATATGSRRTTPSGPRRPWGKYLAVLLALGGLAYAGYEYGPELLEQAKQRVAPPPETLPTGLRSARVVGHEHPAFFAFRVKHMDTLTTEGDIFYNFVPAASTQAKQPLAALAAGEAEFALTTLDRFLAARAAPNAPAMLAGVKIIAIVDVSLGAHSLVLDSVEHPELRSLAELRTLTERAETKPLLGFVEGSEGESLFTQLDALSATLDGEGLLLEEHRDVKAVYDALLATPPPPPPPPEQSEGSETGESTGDEPEPPPEPEPTLSAALLPAPWAAMAVEAGMTQVASSRELPYALVNVLVAPAHVLDEDPELVSTVLRQYYSSLAKQTEADNGDATAVAAQLGFELAEAKAALANMCVLDAAAAHPWLIQASEAGPPQQLATAVSATWAALSLAGGVSGKPPALADIVDARALESTQAEPETPGTQTAFDRCLAHAGAPGPLGALELGGLAEAPWFVPAAATLSPAGQHALVELSARLRSLHPKTSVRITAYGEGNKPKKLGLARAQALVDALRGLGLNRMFEARGAKSSEGPTRRVEIELR